MPRDAGRAEYRPTVPGLTSADHREVVRFRKMAHYLAARTTNKSARSAGEIGDPAIERSIKERHEPASIGPSVTDILLSVCHLPILRVWRKLEPTPCFLGREPHKNQNSAPHLVLIPS